MALQAYRINSIRLSPHTSSDLEHLWGDIVQMSSFLMNALNTGGLINTGRTLISYAIINQVLSSLTSELYHDLIHYFKYASSAYSPVCPRPNGKKLIMPVRDPV